MRFMFAGFCAAVVLAGCSGQAPSPTAPTAPGLTIPTSSRPLAGIVRDERNAPVDGAKVVVLNVGFFGDFVVQATGTTDGSGSYNITEVRSYPPPGVTGWILVGASKTGSFADFKWWLDYPKDADLNFQLKQWTHIPLGTMVQGQIGDAYCAGLGYGGWMIGVTDQFGRDPCQRFAVTVPTSGTLDVTVSAPVFNFDVDVVKPDGTFAAYGSTSTSPLRLAASVEAGRTYEIRVAAVGPAHTFEVTTRLR